ncbi:MAG TPA: cytochrome c peroxidase, partial [Rhodopila sp.]
QGPTGGRDWDGRVDRLRDQALLPLFDRKEMANPNPGAVVAAVGRAVYADQVRQLYGQSVFADPPHAFAAITEALEFYQQTPSTFGPFSSKYDAFLRGTVALTQREARGLAVFNDPAKGNCAPCHRSAATRDGRQPLFTDFGFVALGLPRNPEIPANADPAYVDLGLCGPQRQDLAGQARYCGLFKTPTLRNVALKQSFYHNGIFHTLRDAVAFYAQRDTDAKAPSDLPVAYQGNITAEPPFGTPRHLTDAEVDDLVAFLRTLTDGYSPTR